MKHYTNKKTNEVFGYESIEDAKKYNDDFKNLVEMSDDVFERFKNKPSHLHEWNLDHWIITDEKKAELEREEKEREIQSLESEKQKLIGEMQMHQFLDEIDEAKAIALRVKEINAKIAELKK